MNKDALPFDIGLYTTILVQKAMKQSLLTGALVGGALLTSMATPAQAGTIGCSEVGGGLADKISGSIGCEISGTIASGVFTPGENQDFVNGGNSNFANFTVNTEKFFTASDWQFAGRSNGNNRNDLSAYFTPVNGSPNPGTYNLGDLFKNVPNLANVMLVFKSGNRTSLVGYLLDNRVNPYQGIWRTPFTEPPFNYRGETVSRNVSHISVYYRTGDSVAVPTPALLPALLAFGAGILRKKPEESATEEG